MRNFDGQTWTGVTEPEAFTTPIDVIYTASGGNLWIGTRNYGAFHHNGKAWTRYDVQNGLPDNGIRKILQTKDGSIWIETLEGVARFDGQTWTKNALPTDSRRTLNLRETSDGTLWINLGSTNYFAWSSRGRGDMLSQEISAPVFWTVRYVPYTSPPETEITLSLKEVSQPGNTTLSWQGMDPWKSTPEHDLQYAYRLDNNKWSPFSKMKSEVLLSLSSGEHTFEVKARDRDFNEDATPATITFTVIPPVWQQAWFLGLMVVLFSTIGFQTARVIRRDRKLQTTVEALSSANKDLYQVNVDLQNANAQIKEQTERKSTFLSQMSHEIRTPITSIKGYIDNMLDGIGGHLNDRQTRNLTRVSQNSDHLLGLVNSLLDLSKIEAGRMDVDVQTFNIKNLIIACCDTVHPLIKPNVALTHEVDDNIGEAQTDEGRVRQIIINLLSNALKFTESGTVSVRTTVENDRLVIAVSDTGTGIPADALDSIFEEFKQVEGSDPQHKGTGLGLPITKGFVELLGGDINVQSEAGKGSTFTVQVPMVYQAD